MAGGEGREGGVGVERDAGALRGFDGVAIGRLGSVNQASGMALLAGGGGGGGVADAFSLSAAAAVPFFIGARPPRVLRAGEAEVDAEGEDAAGAVEKATGRGSAIVALACLVCRKSFTFLLTSSSVPSAR